MGKMPYIPIYIGDWEQDTNCISIEAEGALLKLIFKLWKSPTKGLLSISFHQIALLLKKSEEKALEIIKELQENNVLNIEFLADKKLKVESRRMIKDVEKSATYSANGSKGGRGKKKEQKQIKSKLKAKAKPFPEYESDNDNEFNIDFLLLKKGINLKFVDSEILPTYRKFLQMRQEIKKQFKSQTSIEANYSHLLKLSEGSTEAACDILKQSIANEWQGVFELKKQTKKLTTQTETDEQREERIRKGLQNA